MRPGGLAAALLGLAALSNAGQQGGAKPAGHVYFEAEELFSLQPVHEKLKGFFGTGCRVLGEGDAPRVVDKTVFLFGNPWNREDYAVWVRAFAGGDHRVGVEWIGEEGVTRLEPTHAPKGGEGFRWERAGVVKGRRRGFYQLRLHAIGRSEPAIDAVLLTADPECRPKETIRPCDDRDITNGDGEGSTRIDHETVVAGSDVALQAVYSVGRSGIAEGGALRFFIPQSWSPPQPGDPKAPGHVTARASREGVRLGIDCHRPGRGAYALSGELRHQNESFVRLAAGSLREGDTVAITYAGRVQPYTQSAADIRNAVRAWYSPALPLGISTDANADGIFWPLAPERSHRLEVVAGGPAGLSIVVPSTVKVGERFPIRLAALDEHRNPASSYQGKLNFSLVRLEDAEGGKGQVPRPVAFGPNDNGRRRIADACRIDEPGAYAIVVTDWTHPLYGRSNPVLCTAVEPPYCVFWGDLHTHHRRCDGLQSFAEAAAHARDVAGLDVVALSPHACYITDGDLADLWRVGERFNKPGEFITLFAYEWAAGRKGSGHSVIYCERPMPLCFRAWGGGNVVRGRPALWEQLEKHKLEVVEVPHHVRGVTERNPRCQKAIEIYSQWGSHEPGVVANFDDGLKACVFGASDNHTGQPGLQPISNRWAIHHHLGGLTAFLAPRLARRDLFAAIDARRCYATAACRVVAHFTVNGHPMGDAFTMSSPGEPRQIEIEAFASTPIATLVLVRNGEPIRTWNPWTCVARLRHIDASPFGGPTDYYYVRIECDAQRKAWLTPVWVTFEKPIASPVRRQRAALAGAKNLALGKPVTTSFPGKITHGRPGLLTDGKLADHLGHGAAGRVWVQVDLGAVQEVAFIRLWNYFRDGRTYHGNRLALSPTGKFAGEETVVFDSDGQGEYREIAEGRLFAFKPVRARAIRSWLNGNTSNAGSQWIELQAFGPIPEQDGE